MMPRGVASADRKLVHIVDKALAENVEQCGSRLACRPGCTQCCIGVFPINLLDAGRLRQGLDRLEKASPKVAERIRSRARASVRRLSPGFPGNPRTGVMDESRAAQRRFSTFGNDEPCPVLDPGTGLCELYESRPMTCRVFGPPVSCEEGLGVCELCFRGATDDQIAACELKADPDDYESEVLNKLEEHSGITGHTIIAFCLAS
jgi:Fe-S-cluster containining protein